MRGYDDRSYGNGFADVYDDWYFDVTDVDATVSRVLDLVDPGGKVLELGVGTGRLAVPMTQAGIRVTGIDSSEAMLDVLAERDTAHEVETIRGDMVDDLPDGPFDAVLIAYNTIFNLLEEETQQRCFAAVARVLRPGGAFVVEAFVPDSEVAPGSDVTVRSMTVDQVVLSVSEQQPGEQRASGQFIQFSEAGGVRLRPWSIRWASPEQLDAMAATAGFTVETRTGDMMGSDFNDASAQHVTIYRTEPTDGPG
ncbi:MAG: SAM-dependent methyltransferase [Actinobacteria bacterium]|nr:MAG: SAM-dependent methyltransferase [Actinomycetota bacterium]